MSKSIAKQVHDIDDVFDDVVHNLKKMAKHLGEDAGDALSKTAASVAHSAVELMEDAKAQSKVLAEKTGKEVREHPAATAAIAAAAAALIGLAIAQRRKPAA
ncbi:MAG: DUF883 family protein [Caulobacteraceae bacterium]|nr:MAG: DUF883 family protein [Caulobacteraceae bacterium]